MTTAAAPAISGVELEEPVSARSPGLLGLAEAGGASAELVAVLGVSVGVSLGEGVELGG